MRGKAIFSAWLAKELNLSGDKSKRRALEMFAIEGHRAGDLSQGQVREILGLGHKETRDFLEKNRAGIGLTVDLYKRALDRMREALRQ
jgi:hypothetical protein